MNFIGRSVPRLEDRPLVTGNGAFAADISFAAPIAHARRALGSCAWPDNIDRYRGGARGCRGSRGMDRGRRRRHAADRFPSHRASKGSIPIASRSWRRSACAMSASRSRSVFASDPYLAEDAADLVDGRHRGVAGGARRRCAARRVHAGHSTEVADRAQGLSATSSGLRLRACGRRARSCVGRHSGVPLETRGAIARLDAARDVLELHGAAKVPHWNRDTLARMLGRAPSGVHLYEGHVGGGFGIRGEIYPEDVLVCVAALRLGRPVKWIEDRREHLMAANHSRQQHYRVRAAVDAEAACSPSTASSFTIRAPMCAPTPRPCPTSPPPCCPGLTASPPIGWSATSG